MSRRRDPTRSVRNPDLKLDELRPPANLSGIIEADECLYAVIGLDDRRAFFLDSTAADARALLGAEILGKIATNIFRNRSPACEAGATFLGALASGILDRCPKGKLPEAIKALKERSSVKDIYGLIDDFERLDVPWPPPFWIELVPKLKAERQGNENGRSVKERLCHGRERH